jgi:trimeric autotransporter adhesin
LPSSNTVVNGSTIVTIHTGSLSSIVQATSLSEGIVNETWATGLTNWISPQFGAGYQLKLYAGPPGATGTTPTTYTNLPVGGSGNADSWYFDYIAGIVNFADTNVPTAAANVSNVVYAVGARYTGTLGIATLPNVTVSGNVVAGNLNVVGIITGNIAGTVSGNVSGNITGNISGEMITAYQPFITSVGTLTNLTVSGNTIVSNVVASGNYYGNIVADTITPYQTNVVTFTNTTAVKLPGGSSSARPNGIAGYFRYNSDIATIEYYNGSSWIPFNNAIVDQQITPDGVNQSFTLSQPSTAAGLMVSINGTMQLPGVAYTVSGETLTFAEIPKTTDIVDVRFIASAGTTTLDYEIVDVANIVVGTSNVIVDSFNSSIYRSAKYIISSSNGTDASMAEVMLIQNAGTATVSTIGNVNTGTNSLTFYANTSGGTVNLLASGTTTSNQLRIQRTYFNV